MDYISWFDDCTLQKKGWWLISIPVHEWDTYRRNLYHTKNTQHFAGNENRIMMVFETKQSLTYRQHDKFYKGQRAVSNNLTGDKTKVEPNCILSAIYQM